MKHLAPYLLIGLLTACAAQGPKSVAEGQADSQLAFVANGIVCRLGPDDGPLIADRGIGGTGAPARNASAGSAVAETSAAGFTQIVDRGIGGTGIVGVITGFASVCVNGLEVTYDDTAAVDLNGTAAPVSALRAGQVVVIQANGPAAELHARKISLRHEVSGRIESVELGSGLLTIAGRPVSVPAGTRGANQFGLGDWVAVSGLRRSDGVVIASRLDRAPPGVFTTRGPVVQDGTNASVGSLTLTGSMANSVYNGQFVVVAGDYVDGRTQVKAVSADPLYPNPSSYFEPSVDHLVVQAFVRVETGGIWVNGLKMSVSPNLRAKAGLDGIAVVSLVRGPDGSFSATEMHASDLGVHAEPAGHDSRGAGSGNDLNQPVPTRHASLRTPPREDATGANAPTNLPSAGTSSSPRANLGPRQMLMPLTASSADNALASPALVNIAPVTFTPAGIASTNVTSIANTPAANTPAANTAMNIAPVIDTPVLAKPTVATMSSPTGIPAVSPTTTPVLVPSTPMVTPVQSQPTAAPVGVPQVESVYSPLISSNVGVGATTSIASVQHSLGAVLPLQAVQARSVSATIRRSTINLVTTVSPAAVTAGASTAASASRNAIATSSSPSIFSSGKVVRH